VLNTDTQETENLYKAILSWSGRCKHVLTPAKQQASTRWQLYLPLTWDLSRSEVHNLPRLVKGGWVRACSLVGNGVIQETMTL
jgi:hypothetical protein